jgi:OmpA-OmpF porin, OOP family
MNPVRNFLSLLALALALAIAIAPPVAAQRARMPSVEEIVRKLTKPKVDEDALREDAVQVEGRRQRTDTEPAGAIDLAVNFEYASAKLTPDARIVLDNLGRALADPALREARFRIAGHTDARGGDAYNLALSKRRAQSVADYLVRQHHVAAARLSVEGFGRSQLLDPANPESAVNRRVHIANLGP